MAQTNGNFHCTILGAGMAGLSTAFHLGHENCMVYESKTHYGGHTSGTIRDGFTWDDAPHISFTDNEYVRSLFAESVNHEYKEFDVQVGNYYRGHWIDHPAQSNLYQVPEPLRSECLKSFLETRSQRKPPPPPSNYLEWLRQAFGPVFADTFPAAYSRKVWATDLTNLGIDWVSPRIYYPSIEDVKQGAKGPLEHPTHYVTHARYPLRGGYVAFARKMADGINIRFGKTLKAINFGQQRLRFSDGTQAEYHTLVSTIPLPELIRCAEDAPGKVREAASVLQCTSLLVVDVAADHPQKSPYHWIYVYDEDKLSTRISFIEQRSPYNAPEANTGIQVEVYGSSYRPLPADREAVQRRVLLELLEMGLLESPEAVTWSRVRHVPWANVIFDHNRQNALGIINAFLDNFGVLRAGRYSEWKYLWTHDCVLNGKRAAIDAIPGRTNGH